MTLQIFKTSSGTTIIGPDGISATDPDPVRAFRKFVGTMAMDRTRAPGSERTKEAEREGVRHMLRILSDSLGRRVVWEAVRRWLLEDHRLRSEV